MPAVPAQTPVIVETSWTGDPAYAAVGSWSGGAVPNDTATTAYEVTLGAVGDSYQDPGLTSSASETVATLTIDSDVSFTVASANFTVDAAALGVSELDDSGFLTVDLGATLTLGSAADPSTLVSEFDDHSYFLLSGRLNVDAPNLTLDAASGAFILSGGVIDGGFAARPSKLTLSQGAITGYGLIGGASLVLDIDAEGVVEAGAGQTLTLDTSVIDNLGNLESEGAGRLVIDSDVDNQGSLTASGTGAIIVRGIVSGGDVTIGAGSLLSLLGSLDAANVEIDDGAVLFASGALATIAPAATTPPVVDDNGALLIGAGATLTVDADISGAGRMVLGNEATLDIEGATTLDLAGGVSLTGFSYVESASGAATLDNDSRISGSGQIGNANLSLVNEAGAVIDADIAFETLAIVVDDDLTRDLNSGLMAATNGAYLRFENGDFINSGKIEASGGGDVFFMNAAIVGGGGSVFVGDNSKLFLEASAFIDGQAQLSIAQGGELLVDDGDPLTNSVTNNGLIRFAAGATFDISGDWRGAGTVDFNQEDILSLSGSNGVWSLLGGQTVNLDSDKLESAATNAQIEVLDGTISGSGLISDNLTTGGAAPIVNDAEDSMVVGLDGEIDATTPSSGTSQSSLTLLTGTLSNSGALVASDNATLTVSSSFTNNGTVTALAGGSVDIQNDVTGVGAYYISGSQNSNGVQVTGGSLELGGAAAGDTYFKGRSAKLTLDDPASYTGVISGFNGTDSIDMPNFAFTGASTMSFSTQSVVTDTESDLYVTNAQTSTGPLRLTGDFDPSVIGLAFNLVDDGQFNLATGFDGTMLVLQSDSSLSGGPTRGGWNKVSNA